MSGQRHKSHVQLLRDDRVIHNQAHFGSTYLAAEAGDRVNTTPIRTPGCISNRNRKAGDVGLKSRGAWSMITIATR